MNKRRATNVAASVRQRLQNVARSSGRPFQEVLQYYAMERFLYRLAQSAHTDHFVLKGALMFNAWRSAQAAAVQGPSHPGKLPVVRLGIAYGTLPAAQYDGGGALVQPGKGECKMHRLRADGSGVIDLDDLPTPAYNIVPEAISHGKELLLLRDQTLEGNDENVAEPGYIALRWEPSESEQTVERLLFMCGSHVQTVTDDNNWHQIPLQSVQNFDTSTYGINASQHAINLKRDGYYEIFHAFHLGLSTASGEGVARVQGAMRAGTTLPLSTTVACSGVELVLALNDKGHHDEADASCMFWVRRTALGNHWLDFVYKRLEYVNYPEIQVTSLRIRYLGELETPTIQMFAAP